MKRLLLLGVVLAFAAPAHADSIHKIQSSVQLTVNSAATQATRIGNSYSISGNNVSTSDGTNSGAITTGSITSGIYDPGTITATQATAGEAFSFSASYTEADAVLTTAPTVGAVSAFSNQTSNAAGTAGTLAGTIDTSGTMGLTAGGAGTSATGQFVTELTIK
jgi:hypothetical protein